MVMFALWLPGHALCFWVAVAGWLHAVHHGVMLQGEALPHLEGGVPFHPGQPWEGPTDSDILW